MFSSEDMSDWDQQLSQSRVLMGFQSGAVHKGAHGAFYALMQVSVQMGDSWRAVPR